MESHEQASNTIMPGWYPAPDHPHMLQWWDGSQWIGAPVPAPPSSTPASNKKRRPRWLLISAVLIVTVGIIWLVSDQFLNRYASLNKAGEACELSVLQYQVLDGGSAVQMSTESFASTDDVRCVLTELEAPSATWVKIGNTRALDGRQEDNWPGFKASWTYHPDSGLNILIERDR